MDRSIRLGLGMGIMLALGIPGHLRAQHAEQGAVAVSRAVAVLAPTAGSSAHGTVWFETVSDGIRITGRFEGLPAGDHGFHIHEYGDCSAPDGTAAGGHFNPAGAPHGAPAAAARHAGDLGNLSADTQGMAEYDRVDGTVRLTGPNAIIGRGVIVHAGPDDLTSQPTGAAGARLACGVIGVGKSADGR